MKKLKKSFASRNSSVEAMAERATCNCKCDSGFCTCEGTLYEVGYYTPQSTYVTIAIGINEQVN